MDLPEGYYEDVEKVNYFWHYLWLALTVVCMIIIIFRAFTIDRGRSVVKTIEFYPPEGISSAEVGVIIDNSADEGDISSLIPWFAEQGYLKIDEDQNKKIELTKLKSLPKDACLLLFFSVLIHASFLIRPQNAGPRPFIHLSEV